MTLNPTYLIYRTGFSATNGTSVQMSRLFQGYDDSLIHLLWDSKEGGGNSVRWKISTDDGLYWQRPFNRIGRGIRWLKGLILPLWWRSGRINARLLAKSLERIPIRPKQAYVVFFSESEANTARMLWEALGEPPFVLHIMDISHDDSISDETTPNFVFLARKARHVFCLNGMIERELNRLGIKSTSQFPLCSDLVVPKRSCPPRPIKILISGALYPYPNSENRAMQLLCDAWREIESEFPGAELHYSGAASRSIPKTLRSVVRDHGLLPWENYQSLLQMSHLAYVPVSNLKGTPLGFSIPSRIPDYLLAGLPVIACTEKNTAIYEFLTSTPKDCARVVRTTDELIGVLHEFAGNDVQWEKASHAATEFSSERFSISSARDKLFSQLNQA